MGLGVEFYRRLGAAGRGGTGPWGQCQDSKLRPLGWCPCPLRGASCLGDSELMSSSAKAGAPQHPALGFQHCSSFLSNFWGSCSSPTPVSISSDFPAPHSSGGALHPFLLGPHWVSEFNKNLLDCRRVKQRKSRAPFISAEPRGWRGGSREEGGGKSQLSPLPPPAHPPALPPSALPPSLLGQPASQPAGPGGLRQQQVIIADMDQGTRGRPEARGP